MSHVYFRCHRCKEKVPVNHSRPLGIDVTHANCPCGWINLLTPDEYIEHQFAPLIAMVEEYEDAQSEE